MKIVIVGGGFGGVKAALELAKKPNNKITLISKESSLQYYPALYRTATGYSYTESWIPLAVLFAKHRNVRVIRDDIVSFDPSAMSIKGVSGTSYGYGKIIFSLGSITSFFGIEGIEAYSHGIKSEAEIRKLQQHLFRQMRDTKDSETHYVIIGAGPTGVELAGALGVYIRTLRKKYGVEKRRLNINIIEAAPRVLPRSHASVSKKAAKRLKKLGVHVRTNCRVEKQTANELIVNGKALKSQTVIWTSGVANSPFFGANAKHFKLNDRGKVVVNEFMQARPHVYVIGDNAATAHSGLAQTALHDAVYVAKHIGGMKRPHQSRTPASVVPIGRRWATFEWNGLRFTGWHANLLREVADIIGYSDIMPLPKAIARWLSGKRRKLNIPDDVSLENELA